VDQFSVLVMLMAGLSAMTVFGEASIRT